MLFLDRLLEPVIIKDKNIKRRSSIFKYKLCQVLDPLENRVSALLDGYFHPERLVESGGKKHGSLVIKKTKKI